MQATPSVIARPILSIMLLLVTVAVARGQSLLVTPLMEDVDLPSLVGDAGAMGKCGCKWASCAVEAGQSETTVDGSIPHNPLSLQILKLRNELASDFGLPTCKLTLQGGCATVHDSRVRAAEFLMALDAVGGQPPADSRRAIDCPEIQAPTVMSESQAATLRYAADRVEQVAATLQRADLPQQASLARTLVEAVLTEPIANPVDEGLGERMARPVSETFLR